MKFVRPLIDKLIDKIPVRIRNIFEIVILIFLVINCIFTVWGIQTYQNRVVYNKVTNEETNNVIFKLKQKIESDYFTNERMSNTFPNLRVKDKNGNEIWIKTLIPNK